MKHDHPGVYIPPPVIYVAFFLSSIALQSLWPLHGPQFNSTYTVVVGWLFILFGFIFVFPALRCFVVSKNTVITMKPAHSLQTTGIYAYTRNPMYMGLLLAYTGIAFLKGNVWTFIVIPLLIAVVQLYVIKKEEHYLLRAFGEDYNAYRRRVRRWI